MRNSNPKSVFRSNPGAVRLTLAINNLRSIGTNLFEIIISMACVRVISTRGGDRSLEKVDSRIDLSRNSCRRSLPNRQIHFRVPNTVRLELPCKYLSSAFSKDSPNSWCGQMYFLILDPIKNFSWKRLCMANSHWLFSIAAAGWAGNYPFWCVQPYPVCRHPVCRTYGMATLASMYSALCCYPFVIQFWYN